MQYQDHTTNELLKMIKTSDEADIILALLQRVIENTADVRVKIDGIENDNMDLRLGVVKVIEKLLIQPLTTQQQQPKQPTEPVNYN